MHQPNFKALVAGMTIPLCLFLASGSALAHGKYGSGPVVAPIQGTVIGWENNTLRIQTQTASVSVGIISGTHVIRQATGSVADLAGNPHVDADLAKGTTTITAIRIDNTTHSHQWQAAPGKPAGTHSRPNKPSGPAPHGKSAPHTGTHAAPSHVSGQVVTVSGSTVTLRADHGKSSAYTLGGSVVITKVMNGTTTDLAVGETVRVMMSRGGSAAVVIILHA